MLQRKLLVIAALFFAASLHAQTHPSSRAAASAAVDSATPAVKIVPGEKIRLTGVPNAGKISDFLFRGAQPKPEGFHELKKLGITTVIDLRDEREQIQRERHLVESLGMRFLSFPSNGWTPPADDHIAKFLSLLRENPNEKVFVHCRFGNDRTGVFIATYRIASQHWRPDDAIRELYIFGFHGFWHPALRSYVRAFPARYDSSEAFAALRKPSLEK